MFWYLMFLCLGASAEVDNVSKQQVIAGQKMPGARPVKHNGMKVKSSDPFSEAKAAKKAAITSTPQNTRRQEVSRTETESLSNKSTAAQSKPLPAKSEQQKRIDAIKHLKLTLNNPRHIVGKFIQIISSEPKELDTAAPLLQSGSELYGLFELRLQKPCQFKFKYIHPAILQIVKKANQPVLYKKGQTAKRSEDGIVARTPNTNPAKKLPNNLTFAILLENRSWLDQITIQKVWENDDFIRVRAILPKMKQPLEFICDKNNNTLVSWSFYDQKNRLNQIRFYPASIGFCQTEYEVD